MRYEEYKPSESPWVKCIPVHWDELRNGGIFIYHQDKVGDKFSDFELLSLTTQGIQRKNIYDVSGKVPASYEGYQEVNIGDMVFCLFDLDCSAVFSGISNYHGMITSAYDVMKPRENLANPKYLDYWFRSVFEGRYYKIFSKTVRYTINYDVFKALKTPVPPRDEQDQIVRYLDWQLSKINKLIHGYQRQIKLLEERRQTVIDTATTKGIDNVELKDSEVNWVKQIPIHWDMIYSKKLFSERKDKAFSGDEQLTASQKYGIITQNDFVKREGRRVTVVLTGDDILKHVGKGDFVISMRSFQGGLEYSYVDGKISSAYVMLIPRAEKVYDEYFKYLLKSRLYIKALQGTSDLVRDGQALRFANFAKVMLPLIPLNEQKRIADYISVEIGKVDNIIPIVQNEIKLLREYRTRLISDVVTGQMDVREIEIPEYTPEEDTDESFASDADDIENAGEEVDSDE